MAIKLYNPTTPGRRGMTSQDTAILTTNKPLKSLLVTKRRTNGRNNQGRITTRHRGGGARRHYRLVDFALKPGTKATVEHIEYDPNRSAHIARVKDQDGVYHYLLAHAAVTVGQVIESGEEVPIEPGNRLPIKNVPVGSTIHAVELTPGRGAQIARAAGIKAQLIARESEYAQVRMPSGEIRLVHVECYATIGSVGNEQHQNIKIGKAGRNRHLGKRPGVRGVVMNAVDHPHGGGDGGRHRMAKAPRTPWGQKTLGLKTRRRKATSQFIVKSRHAAKRK